MATQHKSLDKAAKPDNETQPEIISIHSSWGQILEALYDMKVELNQLKEAKR